MMHCDGFEGPLDAVKYVAACCSSMPYMALWCLLLPRASLRLMRQCDRQVRSELGVVSQHLLCRVCQLP
jgi:hypothetical protein